MWKWPCIFVIIASAIVSVAYEQHHARETYEAKREEACIALSITSEQKYSCAKEAQSRHDYTSWWYILLAWPEGITTWAIIVTGFVIAWQSNETRRAAEASLLNIKALNTIERSRIHIEAATVDDETRLEFIFTAVNHGRVPARITYYFVEALSLEKGTGFPLPYWSGTEKENARLDAIWIPPGYGNGFQLPTEPDVTLYSKENIQRNAPEEWERTRKGDVALFVYGLLRYRDDISPEEHETRFSYMWTPYPISGLLQGGPTEYTRCT